jgi:hypothetical protein
MVGCRPRPPLSVKNPDPTIKIPAIKDAVRHDKLAAVPQMIHDLNSDDPAVRFFSIYGLRQMTGEDFGYRFYLDEEQRKPAMLQWKQWLESSGIAATQPAEARR